MTNRKYYTLVVWNDGDDDQDDPGCWYDEYGSYSRREVENEKGFAYSDRARGTVKIISHDHTTKAMIDARDALPAPKGRNPPMTSEEFQRNRDRLRWTQKEAGKALGLSIAQISAIENGRSTVTKTVEILFRAYHHGDREGEPSSGWRDRFLTEEHAHIQSHAFPGLSRWKDNAK